MRILSYVVGAIVGLLLGSVLGWVVAALINPGMPADDALWFIAAGVLLGPIGGSMLVRRFWGGKAANARAQ